MSTVTEDEIRSLARLARLALSDEEVRALQTDLSSILTHMQALAEVDTEGVEAMTHVMLGNEALRADRVAPSLDRERVLSASPRHDHEHFSVPAILPGSNS